MTFYMSWMEGYVAREKREEAPCDRMGSADNRHRLCISKPTYQTKTLEHLPSCQNPVPQRTNPTEHSNHPAATQTLHDHGQLNRLVSSWETVSRKSSSCTEKGQDVNEEGVLVTLHH